MNKVDTNSLIICAWIILNRRQFQVHSLCFFFFNNFGLFFFLLFSHLFWVTFIYSNETNNFCSKLPSADIFHMHTITILHTHHTHTWRMNTPYKIILSMNYIFLSFCCCVAVFINTYFLESWFSISAIGPPPSHTISRLLGNLWAIFWLLCYVFLQAKWKLVYGFCNSFIYYTKTIVKNFPEFLLCVLITRIRFIMTVIAETIF